MKKFLFILLLTAFPVFTYAQTATVKLSNDTDGNLVITINSDRDISKGYKYLPLVSMVAIPDSAAMASSSNGFTLEGRIATTEIPFNKNPIDIKVPGTKKNETYHVRVAEIPTTLAEARKFINQDQTITIKGSDIKIPTPSFSKDGNYYIISGSVDTSVFSPSQITVSGQILTLAGENITFLTKQDLKSDGTYRFIYQSSRLTEAQYNLIISAESIFGDKGSVSVKVDAKTGTVVPTDAAGAAAYEKSRSYTLLAPLPGISKILDNDLCQEAQKTNPNEICDINQFINFILKFMIGLAAVVLIVRLIWDGYVYMTSDVPFLTAKAKGGFTNALIGLLVALSSYLILNTINPRLVKNDFSINQATFNVDTFEIGGGLGGEFGTWKPIKVKLDKDVYPAAKKASEKTGVSIPFILAIFQQETGGGVNTGKCKWSDPGVMREDNTRRDQTAFKKIMSELGQNPDTTPVSCALRGGGWGGAIGYTQFLPTTWLDYKDEASKLLGRAPNPWKLEDALLVTALYTKRIGALTNERDAACRYYSGDACDPKRKIPNEFYGNQVMQKKAGFIIEIEKLKKEGKIQ